MRGKVVVLILLLLVVIACSDEGPKQIPENISVVNNMGVLYADQGMYDKAIEKFEKVLEVDPDHEIARKNMALIYYRKTNYSEAKTHWEVLIENHPDNPEYHYDLAINYAENCQYKDVCELDKAIHHFNRSDQIEPGFERAAENIEALRNVQAQMNSSDEN